MSEQRPPRLNLPRDWRLEKPPTGDFRFLGHSDPRGHHDARGVLKKHSQFSPWVLHCVCGRVHSLPALPELPPGTAVMIDMIPPSSPLEELNLLEGTIVGLPRRPQEGEAAGGGDPTVYYPVCIKATGEVVDLPPAWIKTRLFAVRGIMYDGRKRFASRKGEDGSLPPLAPQYPHPILPPKRVNSGRQAMGLFLRNFRGFVCKDGLRADRFGSLGNAPAKWFPETGVPRPPVLLWMDTALTVFSVGQVKWGGRHDPYKEQWPIQLIRGIVRWRPNSNAVDIASDDDSGDDDDQGGTAIEREGEEKDGKGDQRRRRRRAGKSSLSSCSSSSSSSVLSSSSSAVSRSSGSPESLGRVLTLVVVEPTEEEGSWMEHLNPPTPVFLHLRFPTEGIKNYVEACMATITKLAVEEQEAPADRDAGAGGVSDERGE